ncbi:hypothetical protein RAS2_24730 [Phycisphaerae bacterium RAS2]|nr:hypothetical protein RAS2_24730 [Phycisphaerae bacterium RAS2]
MPNVSPPVLVALTALIGLTATAYAKEKQVVTVSYVVGPEKGPPEGITTVAVIDAGVASIDGIKGNARERKWAGIAADLLEAMLQDGAAQATSSSHKLTVVQRRATKAILDEQDLQLVGIVEGDAAARAGKLLSVDGLIMSRININIDVQKRTKSQIDWGQMLGGAMGGPPPAPRDVRYRGGPGPGPGRGRPRGGGGPGLPTREIEEISRSLTVQCSFSLVDAVTGKSVLHHAPPVFQKTDTKSPDFFFGQFIEAGDLDPVDHFIGELVERAARDFASRLVPVTVEQQYEIIGRGKFGEKAVRALRGDDLAQAIQLFEKAHADEDDEPDTVFALGVTCELADQYEQALKWYQKVVSMEDADEDDLPMYLDAKKRLTAHIGRIVRSGPTEAPSAGEPAPGDGGQPKP